MRMKRPPLAPRLLIAPIVLCAFARAQRAEAEPPEKAARIATADSPLGEPAPLPDGAPAAMATIVRDDLRRHEFWLADDARHGRFTGSRFQLETATYIAERFRDCGLEPLGDRRGYLQEYPLDQVRLDTARLTFGKRTIAEGIAVLPSKEDERVSIRGRFLYCGSGRPDEVPNGIRGGIPVVVVTKPPVEHKGPAFADFSAMRRAANAAREFGNEGAAAGVICLLDGAGPFTNALNYDALMPDHPRSRFQGRGGGTPGGRVPVMFLAEKPSRELLTAMGMQFDSDGNPSRIDPATRLDGRIEISVRHDARGKAWNVAAVLRGSDRKKEAVVFSAHMDHLGTRIDGDAFNGADDNASGTAALLEIAEAFSKGGKPARSIVFLSFSGEEQGLYGSSWFAQKPTWPLDQIVANINVDMISRQRREGGAILMLMTPSRNHAAYSTLSRTCEELAAKLGIALSSGDAYYARSDHYNFARKNVPVLFLCDGEPPEYHQANDSADTLDYEAMEAVARLAFWVGHEIAESKDRPRLLSGR